MRFLVVAVLTLGCQAPCERVWGYAYGGLSRYVDGGEYASLTPSGIRVELGGQHTPLFEIDRLTSELAGCLSLRNMALEPLDSFVVRIASDWTTNCDSTQQVFPVYAGPECKGSTSTPQCPCRYRAGVACPNVIVSTPSLYLYKDALSRYLLHSSNPWKVVPECLSPTTTPRAYE